MSTCTVILGSTRTGRNATRMSKYITNKLLSKNMKVNVVDPLSHPQLSTFTNRLTWMKDPAPELVQISQQLAKSDAIVLITPEYNRSFSGALKNVLDTFYDEYKAKPFSIVSYSMGLYGGIRAAEHLRNVIGELGGVPLPFQINFPQIHLNLNDDGVPTEATAKWLEPSAERLANELQWYAEALKKQREEKGLPKM